MAKTKSGFEYELAESARDDFELVEIIVDFSKGNKLVAPELLRRLLGAEQFDRLKDHCRDKSGVVSTRQMFEEMTEILNEGAETKN